VRITERVVVTGMRPSLSAMRGKNATKMRRALLTVKNIVAFAPLPFSCHCVPP